MKLDLNCYIKNLEGVEDKNAHLGKIIGNALFMKATGLEPIKAVSWARSFYNNEKVEIDKNEAVKLIDCIKNDGNLPVAVKAEAEIIIIDTMNK